MNLAICNSGVLNKNAFLLMGASTKRDDDSKIGMFGTGFKYALATLLREKVPVCITSGEDTFEFTTKPVVFRENTFNSIRLRVNKKKWQYTHITAEMGAKHWTVKEALREIISNAIDEGSAKVVLDDSDEVREFSGETIIRIGMTEPVRAFYSDLDLWFTHFRKNPPLFSIGDKATIRAWACRGPGVRVYRKGVLVFEDVETSALYDYDFHDVSVDETRKASEYSARSAAAHVLNELPVEEKMRIVPELARNRFEAGFGGYAWHLTPSRWAFLAKITDPIISVAQKEALGTDAPKNALIVPDSIREFADRLGVPTLREYYENNKLDDAVTLSAHQELVLRTAWDFLGRLGFSKDKYPVVFCLFTDSGIYGEARDGKIYLSPKNFDKGLSYLIHTLAHEIMHLESGFGDRTREFEEYIIERYIQIAAELRGVVI